MVPKTPPENVVTPGPVEALPAGPGIFAAAAAAASAPAAASIATGQKRQRTASGDGDDEPPFCVSATERAGYEKISVVYAPWKSWRKADVWVSKDACSADVKMFLEQTTGHYNHKCMLVGVTSKSRLEPQSSVLMASSSNWAPLEDRVLVPTATRLC